ncbi:hypothetical protein AAZX31_11G227000 [Glycine max]
MMRSSDDALHKCNVMIKILGCHGKFDEARKLFDKMTHRDYA